MHSLWNTLGYHSWKYSNDLWALCGSNNYIWIYKNTEALKEEIDKVRYPRFRSIRIHGPCGPISI